MGIAAEHEGYEHGDDVHECPDPYRPVENRACEFTAKKNPGEQARGCPDRNGEPYSVHRGLQATLPSSSNSKQLRQIPAEDGFLVGVAEERRLEHEVDRRRPVEGHVRTVNDVLDAHLRHEMP
jgi:hypothetical protein